MDALHSGQRSPSSRIKHQDEEEVDLINSSELISKRYLLIIAHKAPITEQEVIRYML